MPDQIESCCAGLRSISLLLKKDLKVKYENIPGSSML